MNLLVGTFCCKIDQSFLVVDQSVRLRLLLLICLLHLVYSAPNKHFGNRILRNCMKYPSRFLLLWIERRWRHKSILYFGFFQRHFLSADDHFAIVQGQFSYINFGKLLKAADLFIIWTVFQFILRIWGVLLADYTFESIYLEHYIPIAIYEFQFNY